ncbi:scytalone dehydratase arp1 [Aspergillus clavatus NRRL 1]|uniref:Conidial pigment biosynthesis scytalone dehydratase Arp1 n=1 Tax=Aspergillus clavatus (strain ATCC 1007 / CBS 513.65 / DSM 816 / NCTC 3887 / NRRL 1 / QM 1276 / 107) TaxID=344612 RepID=A1C887_ASPCL|nr:conidial pigment biosynthesis scytalone dehydratase Arp1 [Aspergillus clavatus NRRL 1]EAW14608.1 conidial pigment biosynthesis scytalone dehydratase Arp1 [Aspergillus clavatus NRRL 1]
MVEKKPNLNIDFQDFLALQKVVFDWADSYDAKDWDRLRSIISPTLTVDYTQIGLRKWSDMPAEDYLKMVTDIDFLGDPTIKTQHLLGATWWEKISDTEVIGHHQLRAAHQVYTDTDMKTVKLKGHSHATNEHYYRKIDGVWKFAGLKPTVRWNEYQFDDVFRAAINPTSVV